MTKEHTIEEKLIDQLKVKFAIFSSKPIGLYGGRYSGPVCLRASINGFDHCEARKERREGGLVEGVYGVGGGVLKVGSTTGCNRCLA